MADATLQTSLYSTHLAMGARTVPFGGWDMPVQYSGILAEVKAVRTAVGVFDVSHMGRLYLSGPNSTDFLDWVLTGSAQTLAVGRARYCFICNKGGGVIDDTIFYRLEQDRYLLIPNAGNRIAVVEWFRRWITEKFPSGCEVDDRTMDTALIAVQGPRAAELIDGLCQLRDGSPPSSLRQFSWGEGRLKGKLERIEFFAGRTGYTGEDGMEIFCPWESGPTIAEQIFKAGAPFGLKLCGLGSRDSLRLEAGYPLYGHEISESISPLQAGLGWTVKLSKPGDFIGKAALSSEKERGPARRIIHFKLEGRRIARQGAPVFCGERQVGEIVSGTLSPIINHPIGTALIETSNVDPDALHVDLRGHKVNLDRTKPPLHKP